MSLSSALSIARRFLPSQAARAVNCASASATSTSSSSSLLASLPGISAFGSRSISSLTSGFTANSRSIQSPLVSALPQTSGFLETRLTSAVNLELKRFGHPKIYLAYCKAKRTREKYGYQKRIKTAGGRAVLWRRIIARKPKLAN